MHELALLVIVPFFIGLGANTAYGFAANYRKYVKSSARCILGSYKLYWYNTRNFRRADDRRLSRATILISRNWLFRVKVTFREDDLRDGNHEGYSYDGTARMVESELHLIMHGLSHAETFYATFGRTLLRGIDCRCGLLLLTSKADGQSDAYSRAVSLKRTR